MALEKCRDTIYRCHRCGYCIKQIGENAEGKNVKVIYNHVCPAYDIGGWESYTARGHAEIASAILEGRLRYSENLSNRIYHDLLCGHCVLRCGDPGVDNLEIVIAMRQDMVKAHMGPPEPLREVDSKVDNTHNVFGEDPAIRDKLNENLNLTKRGDTLYFAGCYDTYRYPGTAKASIDILRSSGISVASLGADEWCCGITGIFDGSISLAEEMVKHNVDAIKNSGAKQVITSCAGCYHVLKTWYPKIMGESFFEVLHINEVIASRLEKAKISFKELKKVVTYHDPCHLGRHEQIYNQPREILKAIPGLKLVEMINNREESRCCGGGCGVVSVAYPSFSLEVSKMRIEDAKKTSAEALVTSCPLCKTILTPAAKKEKIEIYDLPDILRAVLI